jgi:flagellar secretion chaperone FliS
MYRDNYLEDRVMSASPVELVQMLYEGAIEAVERARVCVREGDIPGRARAVTKAADIVGELANSLRQPEGGSAEIETNLRRLYDYVLARLLEGNASQREEPFAEAGRVLNTLREAWQNVPEPASAPAGRSAAAGQLTVQG